MSLITPEAPTNIEGIETAIKALQSSQSSEDLASLSELMSTPQEIRIFVQLPGKNLRTSIADLNNERLRELAQGGSTIVINGIPEMAVVTYDNLSNTSSLGVELRLRKGTVYGLEPPTVKTDFDLVIPLGVVRRVARGLGSREGTNK